MDTNKSHDHYANQRGHQSVPGNGFGTAKSSSTKVGVTAPVKAGGGQSTKVNGTSGPSGDTSKTRGLEKK